MNNNFAMTFTLWTSSVTDVQNFTQIQYRSIREFSPIREIVQHLLGFFGFTVHPKL